MKTISFEKVMLLLILTGVSYACNNSNSGDSEKVSNKQDSAKTTDFESKLIRKMDKPVSVGDTIFLVNGSVNKDCECCQGQTMFYVRSITDTTPSNGGGPHLQLFLSEPDRK